MHESSMKYSETLLYQTPLEPDKMFAVEGILV